MSAAAMPHFAACQWCGDIYFVSMIFSFDGAFTEPDIPISRNYLRQNTFRYLRRPRPAARACLFSLGRADTFLRLFLYRHDRRASACFTQFFGAIFSLLLYLILCCFRWFRDRHGQKAGRRFHQLLPLAYATAPRVATRFHRRPPLSHFISAISPGASSLISRDAVSPRYAVWRADGAWRCDTCDALIFERLLGADGDVAHKESHYNFALRLSGARIGAYCRQRGFDFAWWWLSAPSRLLRMRLLLRTGGHWRRPHDTLRRTSRHRMPAELFIRDDFTTYFMRLPVMFAHSHDDEWYFSRCNT